MINNSQSTNEDNDPNERANLEKIFDFQFDSLKETSKVLEKGVSFYFIIIGIVLGLIFSNKVDLDQIAKVKIFNFLVASSIFTTLCVFVLCWSIISGVISLRATLKSLTSDTFDNSSINLFFKRGIISSILIGVLCSIFMIYIFIYFHQLKDHFETLNNENNQIIDKVNLNKSQDTINVRLIDTKHLKSSQDTNQ